MAAAYGRSIRRLIDILVAGSIQHRIARIARRRGSFVAGDLNPDLAAFIRWLHEVSRTGRAGDIRPGATDQQLPLIGKHIFTEDGRKGLPHLRFTADKDLRGLDRVGYEVQNGREK
jgi:hypothetical protein